MILKETLRNIVQLQRAELDFSKFGVRWELLKRIDLVSPQIIVLSGVRRGGKSILLLQIMQNLDSFYYFNFECDFLVKSGQSIVQAIQVCHDLNEENLQREMTGLQKAMEVTGAKQGMILTLQQKDEINNIPVKPVWQWVLEQN